MDTPNLLVVEGDITVQRVDAIVNAANDRLAAGGGVCGAIFAAAGPGLAEACDAVAPCPTGEARTTPGYGLPAPWIIHAVGPIWRGGTAGEPDLLASGYRNSLALAEAHGLASLAFPAISTGVYGYPWDEATEIAVRAVRRHAGDRHVIFCCFGAEMAALYRAVTARSGRPS